MTDAREIMRRQLWPSDDGTADMADDYLEPDGSLRGAQQERLERYVDDAGQTITERYLPAEPVDVSALGAVIGTAAAQWASQAAALSSEVALKATALAAAAETAATLRAVADSRAQAIAALQADVVAGRTRIAVLEQRVAELAAGGAAP